MEDMPLMMVAVYLTPGNDFESRTHFSDEVTEEGKLQLLAMAVAHALQDAVLLAGGDPEVHRKFSALMMKNFVGVK